MDEAGDLSGQDRRALRAIIAQGSHSFHAASRLLPAAVQAPAFALYAFCRACDDAIDEEGGGAERLARLRQRLADAYRGAPADTPVDRAFAAAAAHHQIPEALPAALIEGLAWDDGGRTYPSLDALDAYAARVAGTVGAMMALVMGARSRQALARATDLASAMQLTNIARDVGEDARRGRLYLPRDWLAEEGIDPAEFLARPAMSPGLGRCVRRLLAAADALYGRGLTGIAHLPPGCRAGIRAAGRIYQDIGADIARAQFDSVSRRARVSGPRKLARVAQALAMGPLPALPASPAPALAANQFLVDAAAVTRRASVPAPLSDLSPVDRILEICLRLQTRTPALDAGK
ncbi:MAG: phytoene/squalene synthase family protein [Pseudomonadota bacterium]